MRHFIITERNAKGVGVSFKPISASDASGLAIEYGDEDLMVYSPAVAQFESHNGTTCFIIGG